MNGLATSSYERETVDYTGILADSIIKNSPNMKNTIYYASSQLGTYFDKSRLNFRFPQMENWKDRAFKELNNVFNECFEENWDGYMAAAVSECVYLKAKKILAMTPSSFPGPDILPEPDGSIGFEWYKMRNFVFVISIADNNILSYAGLFGENNKVHGTEWLCDSLPNFIINCLERLFNNI